MLLKKKSIENSPTKKTMNQSLFKVFDVIEEEENEDPSSVFHHRFK